MSDQTSMPQSQSADQEIASLMRIIELQGQVLESLARHEPLRENVNRVLSFIAALLPGCEPAVLIRSASQDAPVLIGDLSEQLAKTIVLHSEIEFAASEPAKSAPTRIDLPDPNRAGYAAAMLPIVGFGAAPMGMLCVSHRWPTAPDRQYQSHTVFARAAVLVQLSLEQHFATREYAELISAERAKLAGELHDDPIQALTVVNLTFARLSRSATPEQAAMLDSARSTLQGATERMRRMLFELHPAPLSDEGLVGVIEIYLDETLTNLGIDWSLTDDLATEPATDLSNVAFRLFHEVLGNVAAHSQATSARVAVASNSAELTLSVADDGVGFDAEAAIKYRPGHLGIGNVRRQAERLGGHLELITSPGNGCFVELRLPVL